MHKLRCPKPEEFQDCVYWALLARLDQEKSKRKIKVGIKKKPKLKRQVIDYTNKTKTICEVCSKMVWPHHLKIHMRNHQEKSLVCPKCPRVFRWDSSLKRCLISCFRFITFFSN